jgi:hypothetical protein
LHFQSTVYELAKEPYFSDLNLIPEDYIKDHGGRFAGKEMSPCCHCCRSEMMISFVPFSPAGGESNGVHVVLDCHLITGQNEVSTLIAVQNLILLSTPK